MNKQQLAGAIIFIGAFQALVAMAIMESMVPGYNVGTNFLSDLGVFSQTAHIFTATMVIEGATGIIAMYLAKERLGKWFATLIAATGVGSIGIAIFPENFMPITTAYFGGSAPFPQTGAFHLLFALPTFIIAVIMMLWGFSKFNSPFKYISAGLGIFMLSAIILMGAGLGGIGRGGMERLVIYPLMFWMCAVGVTLMQTQILQKLRSLRGEK
jgi:hypothetical membrane protein